jgi:uncharacterized RDD family membrane protein YckC
MYVIDEKSGEPCTWGDSLVRNLFGALGLIDWLFIFGEKHQRLGDRVAGTIVVWTRRATNRETSPSVRSLLTKRPWSNRSAASAVYVQISGRGGEGEGS